jgi:outer membrane receptor protein involved in Fe transport
LDCYIEYLENTTLAGSIVPFRERTFINPLPSASLVRHLNDKMNLKLGVSQTVIRPDAREVSYFKFFDRQTLSEWEGNPELQPTKIFNVDLRFEYFPQGIDMLTVTPFFKFLQDPIEQTVSPNTGSGVYFNRYTLSNAGAAISYGIETEFRKRFSYDPDNYLNNLSIYGNLTLLNSVVTQENEQLQGIRTNRRLQGLSPLLLNPGVLFKEPKTGIGIDLFYNRFGRQIVVVGKPGEFNDLIVLPRDRMDLQISKNFKDKFLLRLIVQDIFNQPYYRVQFFENDITAKFNQARLNTRYMQGRLFTFSLTYKIL